MHPLPRAAGRRVGRRRHRPLPVAPRLLQFAHRRSAARAGARPGRLLACRAAGRRGFRAPESRTDIPAGAQAVRVRAAVGGDRRRRRRGAGGGGNAAARRVCRARHDIQRRRRAPLRPAQSVKGLPRRDRARGLAGAAPARVLCRTRPRSRTRCTRRRDRSEGARNSPRKRRPSFMGCAIARHRGRADTAEDARRRPAACPHFAHPRGLPGADRASASLTAGGRRRRQLYRPRSRRLVAGARARGRCRGARGGADGAFVRRRNRPAGAPGARAARRPVPSRGGGRVDRRPERRVEQRRARRGRPRRGRNRRAAA